MSFTDFSLDRTIEEYGLDVAMEPLFSSIEPSEVPTWLRIVLDLYGETPTLSVKARRESIVYPLLVASRELTGRIFTIYSGVALDDDGRSGRGMELDYALSLARPLPLVMAPLAAVVLGRCGDVESGLGTCLAQMVAARQFNQKKGQPGESIFGCVTTGNDWLFLQLQQSRARIHPEVFYRGDLPHLLGVLKWMAGQFGRLPKKTGKYILVEPRNGGRNEAKEA